MTFPLTKAGRENLEAILAEFERAGRHYPPLYHERLVALSESGEVRLSETQWQAFIDAESNDQGESDWSEWDGPHSANPDFNGTYLGRWYGDPEGMAEFFNLVESVTDVLQREDFSSVPDLRAPFSFHSWNGWLSTIHAWAFRFQIPLLRCEMSLWGAEDSHPDDFIELSKQISQTGDLSWPLHPACWSLTYNVFTSSAAAIRAILRPETVIGINEPWPISDVQKADRSETSQPPGDEGGIVTGPCHRLVFSSMGWCLQLADSDRQIWTEYQAGLHRIAALIENTGVSFNEEELYKFGARNFRQGRPVRKKKHLDGEDGVTERKNQKLWQRTIDEAGCREIGEELRELLKDRDEANEIQDFKWLESIEDRIAAIKKVVYVNKEGIVVPRMFRDPQQKKDYDAICATMDKSIRDLKRQLPAQCTAIKELEDQLFYAALKFEPNDKYTQWRVLRQA